MSSYLVPDQWSREAARHLQALPSARSAIVPPDALSPKDLWNGKDPGHYDEAVALARLFEVGVLKSLWNGADEFVLHAPSAPHRRLPVCSPTELMIQIRHYVEDYLVRPDAQ